MALLPGGADVLLQSGKWYYEVEIAGEEVSGYPLIGWANDLFSGGDGEQHGVGDDENSWGVDGDRVKIWNKSEKIW